MIARYYPCTLRKRREDMYRIPFARSNILAKNDNTENLPYYLYNIQLIQDDPQPGHRNVTLVQ